MAPPYPCPCCGHRTLPHGPGDCEVCPVCGWEDDATQLRYPMYGLGANGQSLRTAQQALLRDGAISEHAAGRRRPPRTDEPRDPGWRPFDPDRDWIDPRLDSERWPVNPEALYYWRPTYWDGDQHRLPAEPRAVTPADRLLTHLSSVPELADAIAASALRWGAPSAFDVCDRAAAVVLAAHERGDDEVALRVVTALVPALDEDSEAYAPNCVVIAFLENEAWHAPWVQPAVDRWPAPVRDELWRQQEALRAAHHGWRRT